VPLEPDEFVELVEAGLGVLAAAAAGTVEVALDAAVAAAA
jgi:hypothetical protein